MIITINILHESPYWGPLYARKLTKICTHISCAVCLSQEPNLPMPNSHFPTFSTCIRTASSSRNATLGFHFLHLVGFGATSLTTAFLLPYNNSSVLTLVLLNSFVKLDVGSNIPLPYNAILLQHLGTPNHFLIWALTSFRSLHREIGIWCHISLANNPNCKHHKFSLPGRLPVSLPVSPPVTPLETWMIISISLWMPIGKLYNCANKAGLKDKRKLFMEQIRWQEEMIRGAKAVAQAKQGQWLNWESVD